jgi:ribonuclease Y
VSPIYVNLIVPAIATLVVAAALFAVWVANRKRIAAETVGRAEEQALRIVRDAERDADSHKKEALLEAKEKAHELLMDAERHGNQSRQQATLVEQTLARRESLISERQNTLERLEKELAARDRSVVEREKTTAAASARYEQLVAMQQRELERVAGLTAEEAKELLVRQMENDARHDAANLVKRLEAEARETAADKAKQYITEAIQRCAAEHAIETTVSVVDLPSDDLATGIDLIVDDTPGAIILSGFDPYRRAIAKKAIERLIADGRIHPARIEEVVQKVKDETDEEVRKEGAAVAFELGLHDLHAEILKLMGRLKYRTSYGQNVLSHSAEVARLAGIMAREIGLDAHVAVRAAFLHDIGKAIDREMQGTHLEIGIDFLRRHGENEAVVMAMAAHHMDIDWPSLEAMIVQAADAVSAARPGARRDILESYVKRLEKLEGIADSFRGVSKSFALQAGREIRIMVESEKISDEEAVWLSKDIARRIENELEYPGQIKVTVIRETRAVDYAK